MSASSEPASRGVVSASIEAAGASGSHRRPIVLSADLHARPAGRISTAAPRFASTVRIECQGRSAAATSVLALMALGAVAGSTVEVAAEGPDASEAVAALTGILAALK